MKAGLLALIAADVLRGAASHATFQALWVDGIDYGSQCARLPASNSPVTDVSSNHLRCNAGTNPVGGKCVVPAGSTVSVEMHQQPGDRDCSKEAIGGAHYGPVMVYMTKVDDAASADGSTGWFKVFEDAWAKSSSGGTSGDDDYWGTKDLNACCGRMDVKVPSSIPSGDYLLRAEAIALHTASQNAGAQFYMTCYQITVTGGSGSASPATVVFPGAYSAGDPGILVNIHAAMSSYTAPGPPVFSGGSKKMAGSGCSGCESTCQVGSGPSGTASSVPLPADTGGANSDCAVAQYQQCGGTGYTGCTSCASGTTCEAISPPYYYQCI